MTSAFSGPESVTSLTVSGRPSAAAVFAEPLGIPVTASGCVTDLSGIFVAVIDIVNVSVDSNLPSGL